MSEKEPKPFPIFDDKHYPFKDIEGCWSNEDYLDALNDWSIDVDKWREEFEAKLRSCCLNCKLENFTGKRFCVLCERKLTPKEVLEMLK